MLLFWEDEAMQSCSELLTADVSHAAPLSGLRAFMKRGARALSAAAAPDTIGFDLNMTRRMLREGQARALVIGPCRATDAIVRALRADSSSPVLDVRGDRLILPENPGTLFIHDASTLGAADQVRLLEWLDQSPPGTSVIAITAEPLFPVVQRGRFLPDLFYRLNLIVIDVSEGSELEARG
jgi:hypothetical protein